MVKFVPVTDVEKPRDAQDHNSSANQKHRKFDAAHTLGKKVVDRGWQQGNVGWGVLGEFGGGKDDGAQVIKRTEGASKMVKNEKGLWVKVKDSSCNDVLLKSSSGSRGRGGGISVLDSLNAPSSSYEKDLVLADSDRQDDKDSSRSSDRSESRFRDNSSSRDRGVKRADSRKKDLSRSRSRSRNSRDRDVKRVESRKRDLSRSRNKNNNGRRENRNRQSRSRSYGRRDRSQDIKGGRDKPRYRSRSDDRSRKNYERDGRYGDRKDNRDEGRGRESRSTRSQSGERSNHNRNSNDERRYRDDNHRKRSRSRDNNHRKRSESLDDKHRKRSGSREENDRKRSSSRNNKHRKRRSSSQSSPEERGKKGNDNEEEFIFDVSAVQLANRFLEVFSGVGGVIMESKVDKDGNDNDDEIEEHNKKTAEIRLNSIASLFTQESAVLSLKSGKEMLKGNIAIRDSFSKTIPCEAKCSYRMVMNDLDSLYNENDDYIEDTEGSTVKSKVSYCLDFHAPFSSPGLGDRSKDTVLLYRCESMLLTHVWGAVDPDKLASMTINSKLLSSIKAPPYVVYMTLPFVIYLFDEVNIITIIKGFKEPKMSKDLIIKSKCWSWVETLIKNDFPFFTSNDRKNEDVFIFHDYNHIETWG